MRPLLLVLCCAVVFTSPAYGADADADATRAAAPTDSTAGPAPGKPRLRFRSRGPVCMCSSGLSEKDVADRARGAETSSHEPQPARNEK